ncbi:hypothetical protein SAY86_008354 [Trapa natans]|uniref:DUF641 domain-containing protein n=1 Tax=Trapa natans TaxID=22666 RepID=A0AAN7QAJ2_TRANT|nr:hypothetical protein SAY86_008354 [Trapa natans]
MFRDVLSLCSFRPDSSRYVALVSPKQIYAICRVFFDSLLKECVARTNELIISRLDFIFFLIWRRYRNKKKSGRGKLETSVAASMDHRHMQFPVMDERDKSAAHRRYEYNYSAFSREDQETNLCRKKVSTNFSDLIQRFATSCLLRPVTSSWQDADELPNELSEGFDSEFDEYYNGEILMDEDEEEVEYGGGYRNQERPAEVQVLMSQMFEAVSSVKMAYMALQEAHCTWDPDRMRAADVAVVEELTRLGALGEMWRRRSVSSMCKKGGGGDWKKKAGVVCDGRRSGQREVMWPYELSVEELKREVKAREVEVEKLREKLSVASCWSYGGGKKSKSQSKRKVSCWQGLVAASPAPELFEATMRQVREASKSFTSLLLSLMRAAHWDIPAAVRSIEPAAAFSVSGPAHRAKYALESYVSRKIFQGFDHETFFMDRSLSSLLNSDQYRHDCFTQFRDMKSIDPMEMLEALPACNFSKFCSVKYLSVIHPKMEESFFGNLDQQRLLMAGRHPRTQFYADFLGLAKAVWLLHLLAFSLEPPPSLFEADRGAEFHPKYMDSVVKFGLGRVPSGLAVGFPVYPGFRLGNGTVIKARVYLVNAS